MFKKIFIVLILCLTLSPFAQALEPGTYDLTMLAGEDFSLSLQLKDGNGQNMDLTGYNYKAQFRQSAAPTGVIYANLSTVFTSYTGGRFNVKLSRAQTATNSNKSGIWDLQQTDSGGKVSYILSGKAIVKPTATR